jgi:hypothetical protein
VLLKLALLQMMRKLGLRLGAPFPARLQTREQLEAGVVRH